MNDSKHNFKLSCLYRDAANYKWFGNLLLSNANNFLLEEGAELVKGLLINQENFDASNIDEPHLCTAAFRTELDHSYYEFESLEFVRLSQVVQLCINEFLIKLINSNSAIAFL